MDIIIVDEENPNPWTNYVPPKGVDGDRQRTKRKRTPIDIEQAPPKEAPRPPVSPISSYFLFFSNTLFFNRHFRAEDVRKVH